MEQPATILLTIGAVLLVGLAAQWLARFIHVPRVTILLITGFALGPSGLDLLPIFYTGTWLSSVTAIALVMVGFLLGEQFTVRSMRHRGRVVVCISLCAAIVTAAVTLVGLLVLGIDPRIAVLLAAIATATAPAASADAVHELGAKGPFAMNLLGIVAVDDAWGLALFSLALVAVDVMDGDGVSMATVASGSWEILGAVMLGVVLGVPSAMLTGRIRRGEPTLIEALGVVLLCGGLALWLHTSFLIAAMVLGAVVANLARHHERPFHQIENIQWPFMILFFVLAGGSLELEAVAAIGGIGAAYVVLRAAGKLAGAWLGAVWSRADAPTRRRMGVALLPQAGVALGMMLIAAERYPHLADTVIPVVIGATVLFEVAGPLAARWALVRARRDERPRALEPE